VRARSSLRVWSIAGFKPLFEGSDKEQGALRPSPVTAMLGVWLFGIVELFWTRWCHCRRREIIGDARTPPRLLFKVWDRVFFVFLWFLVVFLWLFMHGASPESIKGVYDFNSYWFWCFLWFHYIAHPRVFLIYHFLILKLISCSIELANMFRKV